MPKVTFYSLFITPFFIIYFLTGCTTFNPAPYQDSLNKIKEVDKQTTSYHIDWHDGFVKYLILWQKEYITLLKSKLKSEIYLILLHNSTDISKAIPISTADQDIYFPVKGNRTLLRENYNKQIITHIIENSFELKIAGTLTTKNLIEIHKQILLDKNYYEKLSGPQIKLYQQGILTLDNFIFDLPSIDKIENDFNKLIDITNKYKNFNVKLSEQHTNIESELISSLQAAASALESNLWLVNSGGKAIETINSLIKMAPESKIQPEEKNHESK